MANGARTMGAVQGAALGATAGPVGAAVGGALGYGLASFGSIFGKKKKQPPPTPPPTFWQKNGVWIGVAGVGFVVLAGGVLIIVFARRK